MFLSTINDSTQMHIGTDPQMFVDSGLIECTQGLTRRWHKPRRHGDAPLVAKDQPWEDTPYFTYANHVVIRDPEDGRFKCWYEDLGPLDGRNPVNTSLVYAESEDGLHFRKPELDVCVVNGKKTSIVMGYAKGGAETAFNPWAKIGAHAGAVVLDPLPPTPDQRFRTIFSRATRDQTGVLSHIIECAHSADGIHWTPYKESPTLGSSGGHLSDVSIVYYDDDSRMFVQNTRHGMMGWTALPPGTPIASTWFGPHYPHRPDLINKRRVYQTRSHDFVHWSELLPVSIPDDELDNLDEAHYGMGQFRIGRMHFGLLGVFRYVDNEMDVRLLHSRDGIHFTPADRGNPFLAPRGSGHWDAHMVSMAGAPIEMGDEWWFYHGGSDCHHDWWLCHPERMDEPENEDPPANVHFGLGLAKLRKEGFASLDGSRQRDGYVLTKPFMSNGNQLLINARCRPGGSVRVEVRGMDNQPLKDRALDACDVFGGDATAHRVSWKGDPSVSGAGEWRKLSFFLRDAELFSFRLA